MVEVPQIVIDHCNKYKLCRGCQFECRAPVNQLEFDAWLTNRINEIVALYENERRVEKTE